MRSSTQLRLVFIAIFFGLWLGQFSGGTTYLFLGGFISAFLAVTERQFWLGVLGCFFISIGYSQWTVHQARYPDQLSRQVNQTISLTGIVTSFPDIREESIRALVTAENDRFLLIISPDTKLRYGDQIKVKGVIHKPENFEGFDYKQYLRRFDVQTIMRFPEEIKVVQPNRGHPFLQAAFNLRERLAANLKRALPQPHNQIAMGILLGVKQELPSETKQDFQRSGLMHLLVVSGFNVTIVMVCMALLLRRLGRRIVFIGSGVAILFFVAMTGAEAPIVRAALMGGLVGWAKTLGRFSDSRNVVLLSLVLIGVYNPLTVHSDIGFYLSGMATLGIILGSPLLERALAWLPAVWELRTILAVTIAAQIAVLPILGLYFGEFPLAGLIANLLAEPLVPLGMFFSSIVTMTGFIPIVIAEVVATPALLVIEGVLQIAHWFGQFDPVAVSPLASYSGLSVILGFFLWQLFVDRPKKLLPNKGS